MLFNSINFIAFFPIVVFIYFIIPKKIKYLWLLVTSYFFYMCWNAKYVLLLLFSTVVTYAGGIVLDAIKSKETKEETKVIKKKLVVATVCIINLSILFFFKYFNFSMELITSIFNRANIEIGLPSIDVILPVGISFYIFQALGYTIDVYREEIYAEKNFFKYALFVSFFPQLVAGPIERSKNLLRQLAVPTKFSWENFKEGFLLMLWGYFMKIILADRIGIFVDTVYGDINTFSGYYLLIATILFAFQIYCDFAGYSTIAIGAAKILNIKLMENFDAPYLALSVAEFWRRWHISLTSWIKDYLYIPLGGSRKGKFRKYFNKIIVFLVSGLWHGASLTYVVWGGINGLYQVIGEILQPLRNRTVKILDLHRETFGHKLLHIIGTFFLIDFSWVFFRAENCEKAINIISSIFKARNIWILFDNSLYTCGLDSKNFWLMIFGIVLLIWADNCKRKGVMIRTVIMKQDMWFRCVFISACILGLLVLGEWGPAFDKASFIYFQF